MQTLFRHRRQFIDDRSFEAVPCPRRTVGARVCGQREHQFPYKRRDREHRGAFRKLDGPCSRQEQDAHIRLPVGTVLMLESPRRPGEARGRSDPGSVIGRDGEDSGRGVYEVALPMAVGRHIVPMWEWEPRVAGIGPPV